MEKQEIKKLFFDKGILNGKGLKKFCWEKYFDEESQNIFNEFKKSYRTDDEAWFCLCRDVEPYHCEVCGNLAKFTGSYRSLILGYNTTCEKCSTNQTNRHKSTYYKTISLRTDEERKQIMDKRRQTNKEKYGDENYTLFGSKSFKQNLLEKYGDEHYSNHEQARKTLMERYGVDHNFKLLNSSDRAKNIWETQKDKILKKQKRNALEKYGYESANQVPEIIQKKKDSMTKHYGTLTNAYQHQHESDKKTKMERYGDPYYHNKEKGSKTIQERHLKFEQENNCIRYTKVLELYGQGWKSLNLPIIYNGRFRYISNDYIQQIKEYAEVEHNMKMYSKQEEELFEFIKSLTQYKIVKHSRNIIKQDEKHKLELDIYIPKLKIAFEYNGSYWHSDLFVDKYYHQQKTKLCYEKGIQLIHIYDFEWTNNNELIKDKIKELLNGKDCTEYNWIPTNQYNNYKLSEPEIIKVSYGKRTFNVYNEGKFIKI